MCGIPDRYGHERLRCKFIAHASVAASTVRGQGHESVRAVRAALANVTVYPLLEIQQNDEFFAWLNEKTDELSFAFPRAENMQNWGAARKILNIYVFALSRDYIMRQLLDLENKERYLEVPLDNKTAKFIWDNADEEDRVLILRPYQFTIKRLVPIESNNLQFAAQNISNALNVPRAWLDFQAWAA